MRKTLKKVLPLISLVIVFHFSVICQNVNYFELQKFIVNGKLSTNVSGGQFIVFAGKTCFESDVYGAPVGHGSLRYNKAHSDNSKSIYEGSSYWGDNTEFVFNADKSKMVVVDKQGNKYVYRRSTPPAGVTTCSLIRKVERNPNNDFNPTPAPTPTPYPPDPYNPTPTPTPNPTPDPPTPNPVQPHQVTKDCNLCHGSGKCNTCNGKHWYYGIGGTKITCPNCTPNGACSSCGGSGKKTTTEYR